MKATIIVENKKVGVIELAGVKFTDVYLAYQCSICGDHGEIKVPRSLSDMICNKCEIKNKGRARENIQHKLFITGIRIGI